MQRSSRRAFVAGGIGLVTATAGCLSGGEETTGTEDPTGNGLSTPVAGNPDADLTVSVWEDYACPHCQTYSLEVFPQLSNEYLEDGTIRYEFHDFPIPVDATASWQAANAARAVQDQVGDEAFFEYSKALFENQRQLGPETYASLADGFDVDGETVRNAATERTYDATVSGDKSTGQDRGVSGTPTVFVDGSKVEWQAVAYEPVRDAIEAARSG